MTRCVVLLLIFAILKNACLTLKEIENKSLDLKEICQNDTEERSGVDFTGDHRQIVKNDFKFNVTEHTRSKRGLMVKKSIKMPSGDVNYIFEPKPSSRTCGIVNTADFIDIKPKGWTRREYEIIANEMERTKKAVTNCAHRGGCVKSYKIFKIRKVINGCVWSKYKDREHDIRTSNGGLANKRLLFYGTNDVWDVVDNGFDERYVSAGDRPFGAGLYFAATSSAANELAYGRSGTGCPVHNRPDCTECKRRMIIARVALGKEHALAGGKKLAHAPVGFDSVLGKLPSNPYEEYVIYRGEQAYPEYVISYVIR